MERTPLIAIGLLFDHALWQGVSEPRRERGSSRRGVDDWSTITARTVASPQLFAYDDCEELEQSLKQSLEEEYRIQLLQAVAETYYYGGGMWAEDVDFAMDDGAVAESGNSTNLNNGPTRVEGEDYSGTNNQESGVDEADFVKTDGYHIYYLQGQQLHILGVPEFGELEMLSATSIGDRPVAMMLDGDQLVVISNINPWSISEDHPVVDAMGWQGDYGSWRTSSLTKFTVFDITNRSQPEIDRELYIEGNYITAREVNGTVRTVTHAWMDVQGLDPGWNFQQVIGTLITTTPFVWKSARKWLGETMESNSEALSEMTLSDLIPQSVRIHQRRSNGPQHERERLQRICGAWRTAPTVAFPVFSASISLRQPLLTRLTMWLEHGRRCMPPLMSSFLQKPPLTGGGFWGNEGSDEMTNLHTLDISAPDATIYTGSGRVNGTVVNQFALSEHEGVLRVATTTGQWAALVDGRPGTDVIPVGYPRSLSRCGFRTTNPRGGWTRGRTGARRAHLECPL